MSHRERLTHRAILDCCMAIAVIGVLMLRTQTGFAAQDKCQAGLEKAASRFASDLRKNLAKCADAVAKAQVKGTAVAKAAASCEKVLEKVYNVAGTKGSSSVTKFRTACSNLTTSGKCTSSDLTLGNYLLSGPDGEAPPATGDVGTFTCDWLLLATEKAATEEELFAVPTMLDLLSAAVTAPESKPGKGDGTNCSDPSARGYRPNLCRFGIECHQVACQLDNSGPAPGSSFAVDVDVMQAPHPVTGHFTVDICKGAAAPLGVEPSVLYLAGEPSRALVIQGFRNFPAICIDVVRAQGWCDCSSAGESVHLNPGVCRDRITSDNTTGTDDCGGGTSVALPDEWFPGTKIGSVVRSSSGSSVSGDCFLSLTTSVKALTSTNDLGPDGVACNDDDLVSPSFPFPSLIFTTGTAQGTMKETPRPAGRCSGGVGTLCIEDANCATANGGPGGTCTAPSPTLATITQGPVTGLRGSCVNYEAGNLTNVTFVAATPFTGPGGSDGGLTLMLKCQ